MSTTANFYEILECRENATLEELKHKYKQLILQYHPDKMNELSVAVPSSSSSSLNAHNDDKDTSFHRINTAWNTLKDPTKRKLYDAELCLNRFQLHNNVFDRMRLEDLDTETCIDDDGIERTIKTYRCRCGGQYIFECDAEVSANNDANELLIECSECSLVIVLTR